MNRHFTVSGFVVHDGRTALHWHRKLSMWLPAGGHVEPNEDPVEAVLREVSEEFAVEAEVMRLSPPASFEGGPRQIEPPFRVQNCVIDVGHEHIDFVYFLTLLSGHPGRSYDADSPLVWFTAAELEAGSATHGGEDRPFAADVIRLGVEAIRLGATLAVRTS
jgi:8-oxo-dGTP pyrophosphatase MutT (NUDIX family)